MKNNEVAIIGLGFLSPAGRGLEGFYRQINEGSPTEELESWDPDQYLGKKGLRYISNPSKLYCHLSFQCLENAGLQAALEANPHRFGLYDGSEVSFVDEVFGFDLVAKTEGPNYVSPMKAPSILGNSSASLMAIKSGITGPNFSVCGGNTGSLQALDIASLHILEGITDYGIVTATENDCSLHQKIRQGERRKHNYKQAPVFGTSFAITRKDRLTSSTLHYLNAHQFVSGQNLGYEENHELLIRLFDQLFQSEWRSKDIDAYIIGGVHNLDVPKLMEEIWWNFEVGQAKIHLPEHLFGTCDNNAGSLALLYAKGLAEGRIEKSTTSNVKRCLVATVDRLGYAVACLISLP